MQILKPDLAEAQTRMTAWWDHEATDRPVIAYTYANPDMTKQIHWDHWFGARYPDKITEFIEHWEKAAPGSIYGGERIPNCWPNYGPGIMAAVMGVTPQFLSETMWFERPTKLTDIVAVLESAQLNANNEWYTRIVKVTEAMVKSSKGAYTVGFTDIGGVLDVLASFLTPKDMIMAMHRQPAIIDTCRVIILEKWIRIYKELQTIIAKSKMGYNAWLGVWCPKPWYPLQCDFAYMLSPRFFKRFVLPDLKAQCDAMDYAIYHLDGANQLPYLEDLLAIPNLTGIQWVPGSQGPEMTNEKWIPIYQKIQAAGKNVIMDSAPEHAASVYKRLDPKGLYVSTGFGAKIMAEFFLPKFMGGMEGVDTED